MRPMAANESASDELRTRLIHAMEVRRSACPGERADSAGVEGGGLFAVVDGPDLPESRGLLGHAAGLLSGERLLDDELAIISRFPIVAYHQLIFSEAVDEDRWAAKGVLHARLWRGLGLPRDHTLDVFTSHFQAGDGADHRRVRASQLVQTLAFIRRHNDPATPVILGGDLNMDGLAPDDGEYRRLAASLHELGLYDAAWEMGLDEATDRAREERIDYEFHWDTQVEYCSFGWMKRHGERTVPLGGVLWEGGAPTFINKGENGRWRDILTVPEIAAYEARAVRELGRDCARWLAMGEHCCSMRLPIIITRTMVRASATRCCWPPESWRMRRGP